MSNRPLTGWKAPAPWIALVLLAITAASNPPRQWFWLALLVIVLVVGWLQLLRQLRQPPP
jgi:apolipoprotein N-acyltransferase